MSRDPMHKTVCDRCGRGTWYETEGQACRMGATIFCPTCHQSTGEGPCPGHLRLIDRSELAPQFAAAYASGERIRVRFSWDEDGTKTKTGTVGKTTGWKPAYLLMARSDSIGSSDLLGPGDRIIAVKRGAKYVPTYA